MYNQSETSVIPGQTLQPYYGLILNNNNFIVKPERHSPICGAAFRIITLAQNELKANNDYFQSIKDLKGGGKSWSWENKRERAESEENIDAREELGVKRSGLAIHDGSLGGSHCSQPALQILPPPPHTTVSTQETCDPRDIKWDFKSLQKPGAPARRLHQALQQEGEGVWERGDERHGKGGVRETIKWRRTRGRWKKRGSWRGSSVRLQILFIVTELQPVSLFSLSTWISLCASPAPPCCRLFIHFFFQVIIQLGNISHWCSIKNYPPQPGPKWPTTTHDSQPANYHTPHGPGNRRLPLHRDPPQHSQPSLFPTTRRNTTNYHPLSQPTTTPKKHLVTTHQHPLTKSYLPTTT